MRAAAAGLAYFALVFTAGIMLGSARTLAVAPQLGPVAAVLIELPFMLAISWLACGWSVRRFSVPAGVRSRLLMGAIAFGMLMAAELALAILALGRSLASYRATLGAPEAMIGLAGQLAFAFIPLAAYFFSRKAT